MYSNDDKNNNNKQQQSKAKHSKANKYTFTWNFRRTEKLYIWAKPNTVRLYAMHMREMRAHTTRQSEFVAAMLSLSLSDLSPI